MSNLQSLAPQSHSALPQTRMPPLTPGDRFIAGLVLAMLTFWLFGQSVVNIAPNIQQSLGISNTALSLALSCTPLFCGCFIVIAGGLADRYGLMRLTRIGLLLSILGSLLLTVTNGSLLLILGRIIQGLSGACIMPATLALVKHYYQGAARQRALSFWSIGSWGGSGISSLVGGTLTLWLAWRWIFVLSILCALVSWVLIRGVPEHQSPSVAKSMSGDTAGMILFVVVLLGLNLMFSGLLTGSLLILTGVLCLLASVGVITLAHRKAATAFIDLSLFRNRPYSGATLSNFLLNTLAGTLLVTSTYLQEGRGVNAFRTGMLTIGYLLAVLIMIRIGEKVLQRVGAKTPMLYGPMITAVGVTLMALTFLGDQAYQWGVASGFILFGLGLGLYATPSTDTAVCSAPANNTGMASGVYKMASTLGGAFGLTVSASMYAAVKATGAGMSIAASAAILVNTGCCLLALLVVWRRVPANMPLSKAG